MFETLGFGLLVLIVAMSISMALIPIFIKYASQLGMIDLPDARKVHVVPIPRVGGIGIVIGALLPIAIWLSPNDIVISYLLGSLVLLVFGVWDDAKELGHYVKFIGQFVAVLLVVYYGGLYVTSLPLIEQEISAGAGKLLTVIAMIGMINAINHSDGLDGLAGGESLLSLAAILYFGYQVEDTVVMLICLATIGGVFGFLRFNSHPARVFMGDGGSQFLGFTLGFLVIYLTQVSNSGLSPVVALLLLGLPVIDIVAVFFLRIRGGMNWFKATRNHIHHRLLDLGFPHYQSVIIIYMVQALLVLSGVLLPYESDPLLLAIYLSMTLLVFGSLMFAERAGWQKTSLSNNHLLDKEGISKFTRRIALVSRSAIEVLLSLFLIMTPFLVREVPLDFALAATVLAALLTLRLVFGYRVWFLFLRLLLYVSVAFVAYLLQFYPPEVFADHKSSMILFYGLLVVSILAAVRFSEGEFFQASPLDFLVLLMVAVLAFLAESEYANTATIALVVKLVVLFYGVEVVIRHLKRRVCLFTLSALASLCIVSVRGFL